MKNIKIKKKLVTCFLFTVLCGNSFVSNAQNFNYEYADANGNQVAQPLGKSIVEMNGQCGVATVNSIFNTNLYTNFQITFLDANGDLTSSYEFGDPMANEVCNGVCKSLDFNDQYLLCGKGKNDQMLVMKVNELGDVLWSKEITFSFDRSEAITIFQVNNNPADKGYIVVGNSSASDGTNSVAAAKLDENGTLIWSAEYNMGSKIAMTDAIARGNYADRVVSIVGFQQNDGIFYLNIYASNGSIFYYPGANYELASPEALDRPQLTEIRKNRERATIISFNRVGQSGNAVGVNAFRTNGYYDFSVVWSKYYEQAGQHAYFNADIIDLSTNHISMIGSVITNTGVPPLLQDINPYVLKLDYDGLLVSARDFNLGGYEFSGSIIESCISGYEAFNTYNLEYGVSWEYRVLKQDSPGILDCEEEIPWDAVDDNITVSPSLMTESFVGTITDYNVESEPLTAERFDCSGNQLMAIYNEYETALDDFGFENEISGVTQNQTNSIWFYPNPATDQLCVNLTADADEVKLFDVSGHEVLSKKGTGVLTISLADFAKGIYFIEKIEANQIIAREKLIIR